jgi:hypothetical protein
MGICTLTEMNESYQAFIPDHPFININQTTIESILRSLINDKGTILKYGMIAKEWVEQKHNIKQVSKKLYKYYEKIGL